MGVAAGRIFYELVPDRIVGWDAREIAVPPGARVPGAAGLCPRPLAALISILGRSFIRG